MAQLTAAQARALADQFEDAADAVSDFRDRIRSTLSDDDFKGWQALEARIRDQSDHFTAQAITIDLQNVQDNIDKIVKITKRAKAAIDKLNEVRKVTQIVGSLIALGDGVLKGDVGKIATALQGIETAVAGQA
jgi:hypothetical protein